MDFRALEEFLRSHEEDEFSVTFSEIECVTGPISPAYIERKHLQYDYYPFGKHTVNAGFSISNVDYTQQTVTFTRNITEQNSTQNQPLNNQVIPSKKLRETTPEQAQVNVKSKNSVIHKYKINKTITDAFSDFLQNRYSTHCKKIKLGTSPIKSRKICKEADVRLAVKKADVKLAVYDIYYSGITFRGSKIDYAIEKIPCITNVLDWLSESIYNYFNNKKPNTSNIQDEFDEFHKKLCNDYIKKSNNCRKSANISGTLSYGNAQKMINMIFKYLACYEDYDKFADLFSYCHIPIDSIILCCMQRVYDLNNTPKYTCICKKHGIPGTAKIKVSISQDNDGKFSYSASFDSLSWSQLDEPHYLALVEIYRAAMESSASSLPIESHPWLAFDFHYWRKNPHKVGNSYIYDIIPIPATSPVTPIPQFYM